ncbi:hypothetical protein [Streptomyces soliscabiei]|uniref:hypothetical protein n=1 Tax=Streptomyces soliscabiei TaxID=588897 RepID=UPI0029B3F6FE|nr:hypothetical protein [Streptomyces sp. NY05-11A]MDX2683696.1 hypothetical protein [Streptomyces sp. NY05-11A]
MSGNTTRCPERVTLACDACGHRWRTREGESGTVHCPECSHPHRIQAGCGATITVPAGSTRPPITLDCYACDHQWDTRAQEGGTVRCPECRHPRRVPTGARDHIDPGTPREVRREAPAPKRPATPRPEPQKSGRGFLAALGDLFNSVDSTPAGQDIDCLHCGHEWTTTAAPGNSVRCPECRRMRRIPTGTGRPRPPSPRKAPAPAAPRAARPAAPRPAVPGPLAQPAPVRPSLSPWDIERERNRRDRTGMLVRSLGGPLYMWVDQPPGACEVLDSTQLREHQRCPRPANVSVQFRNGPTEGTTYACLPHGAGLLALTERSPYITAETYPLRNR